MKLLVALAFAAILAALAAAGVAMLRNRQDGHDGPEGADPARSRAMMRALAWRVGISVTLFIALLLAYGLGWIEPTGIALR